MLLLVRAFTGVRVRGNCAEGRSVIALLEGHPEYPASLLAALCRLAFTGVIVRDRTGSYGSEWGEYRASHADIGGCAILDSDMAQSELWK
ncbi:MAG: hypothetical protein OJF49_001522 [Ktedonobacterales bacterium]|nr:MAG: hypothetical protein OJF49_001522 [Ktedonobacterales bacterium]